VTDQVDTSEPVVPPGDNGLARLRLDFAYDGTEFFGWARQPEQRTVQEVLEDALATILRLPESPRLTVAGRTDTGVHATGQVAHVDLASAPEDFEDLLRRLAGVLPPDVRVRDVHLAPGGFDARFAALGRHYVYRVTDGFPNPLRRRDTLAWPRPLDVDAMNRAAAVLLGEQDFASYCKPRDGATTIRTLNELSAARDDETTVLITARADAFCRHQVRSMVGALLSVGEGRRAVEWPGQMLAARERSPLINVAAALGLTLVSVDYPPDAELAARLEVTRQRRV
jgi:tRNA pseudouridine38-40 synthase